MRQKKIFKKIRLAKTLISRLRAVLVSSESDSVQCQSAQSPTPCSVSQQGVSLRAVLVSKESHSAQCQSARSRILRIDRQFSHKKFEKSTCGVQFLLDHWKQQNNLTPSIFSLHRVQLHAVLVRELFISRISPQKQIFQQNHLIC